MNVNMLKECVPIFVLGACRTVYGMCLLFSGQINSKVMVAPSRCFSWHCRCDFNTLFTPFICVFVSSRHATNIALMLCSVFGEDALVNVSVEKKDDNDGKLAGYIRIRSKTQGIALSLGDRITSVQRGLPENKKH